MRHVQTCSLLSSESIEWVCVCSHIQKQANTPAVLKAGDINPFTDHTSLRNISHQSLVRDDVITIDQNRLRKLARGWKCMIPSAFMNEQPVLLSYTSPSCSAFGLVHFEELSFSRLLYSKCFLLAIARRIGMQGGLW